MEIVTVVLRSHRLRISTALARPELRRSLLYIGAACVSLKVAFECYRLYAATAKCNRKHQQLERDRTTLTSRLSSTANAVDLSDVEWLELQRKLKEGEVTPLDVLHAFQRKAIELLPLNCVGEVILEADDIARKLAARDASSLLLYGVPVSIKDTLRVKGYDAPYGLVQFTEAPAHADCLLVEMLKDAGAVPFVITPMAPTGLSIDASNPVYGKQRHPDYPLRLAGGSSGGEAILIAKGGSILGFGTDVGGSVRIPAAFCGISALKPTFARLGAKGKFRIFKTMPPGIPTCIGPMARTVAPLTDAMRALLVPALFAKDATVVPMPFDEGAFQRATAKYLTIGFYTRFNSNVLVEPVPAIQRAVLMVKRALTEAGHRVIEFNPPDVESAYAISLKSLFADGGRGLRQIFRREPTCGRFRMLLALLALPSKAKRILGMFAGLLGGRGFRLSLSSLAGCSSAADTLDLLAKISDYKLLFAETWLETSPEMDAVICPATALPAPPADSLDIFTNQSLLYTLLYNLVDYPAGVVPVTKVTKEDVRNSRAALIDFKKRRDHINAAVHRMQRGSEGLPLAVQVVGKPFHEELVLKLLQDIEEAVKYWQ